MQMVKTVLMTLHKGNLQLEAVIAAKCKEREPLESQGKKVRQAEFTLMVTETWESHNEDTQTVRLL